MINLFMYNYFFAVLFFRYIYCETPKIPSNVIFCENRPGKEILIIMSILIFGLDEEHGSL